MGSKLSCHCRGGLAQQVHQPTSPAPARIIVADGSLKELPGSPPVAVSDVLGVESASFFVCNSDALYFDEDPPALPPGELLLPGQIYFVLPAAMLGRPLSSAEMAKMAVRASAALSSKKPHRRRVRRGGGSKKVRVMPLHEELEGGEDVLLNEKLNERTLGEFAVSLSQPKSDQKPAAATARSRLKRALSIIQEDAD